SVLSDVWNYRRDPACPSTLWDGYRQEYACADLSPIHRGHNKHTTYFPGQARSNLPAVNVNTNRRRQHETHSHQTPQMAHRSGRGSIAHRDAQLRLVRHRGYCLRPDQLRQPRIATHYPSDAVQHAEEQHHALLRKTAVADDAPCS